MIKVDLPSATRIIKIYDALASDRVRTSFEKVPLQTLLKIPANYEDKWKYPNGSNNAKENKELTTESTQKFKPKIAVVLHNERTGEKFDVALFAAPGDAVICVRALQNAASGKHMKYSTEAMLRW